MKNRNAFTLVEVIVSLMLIVAVSIAGLEFFRQAVSIVTRGDLRLVAANFARETMEDIYQNNWDTLIPPDTVISAGGDLGILQSYGGSRTYQISDNTAGYKVLTVIVNWTQ